MNRGARLGAATALIAVACSLSPLAEAARVGVLSNKYFAETAALFNANIPGHTFTGLDVSTAAPTLAALQGFDVVLLFEDGRFANAPTVGNVVAAYANSGRAVVLGTFYDQDRSDSGPAASGWGLLETIDPNTSDGSGTPYAPRTLNASSIVPHPLTLGLTSLTSQQFAGGNRLKPGSVVVAYWTQPNAVGQPDPAIAVRVTGAACVMQVGIAPDYPVPAVGGPSQFSGDFYRVWKNAFDFGANHCQAAPASAFPIPALSDVALALTALLIGVAAFVSRRPTSRHR
jgi:hypothetical protein